ncbi:MAG: hypothetical protein SGILL_010411 [Bacillariaceae sp.]
MPKTKEGKQRPLNFLHIPKTGGSSIEMAAAMSNVSWGSCLFRQRSYFSPLVCPPYNPSNNWLRKGGKKIYFNPSSFWHIPIQYLPFNYSESINFYPNYTNPYADHDLFVVVRNPYKRAVSEYYFRTTGRAGTVKDTVWAMNAFIQSHLKSFKESARPTPANRAPAGYFQKDAHFIPQYDFVYLTTTPTEKPKRIVRHIVHFEHLNEQFESLMQAYNLKINLTAAGKVHDRAEHHPKHTVAKLSKMTRLLIEDVYAKDFEMGGYTMIEKEVKQKQLK